MTYCYAHDPARSEARKRAASKAGRARVNPEIATLRTLLEDLTERVIAGELDTARGAVAGQLINARIRLLEQERRALDTGALESQLQEIEHELALLRES